MPFRLSLVAILYAVALHAAPHRMVLHPNERIRIHEIAEGPDGTLWLAADDGLYRFDGIRYTRDNRYPWHSARVVAWDRDAALWAGGSEGLARLEDGFRVVTREPVSALAAGSKGVVFSSGRHVALLAAGGKRQAMAEADANSSLMVDVHGRIWYICASGREACRLDPDSPSTLNSRTIPSGYTQVVAGAEGEFWLANPVSAIRLGTNHAITRYERFPVSGGDQARTIYAGRNGKPWLVDVNARQLPDGVDFRDRRHEMVAEPTAAFEDSRGRLWIARAGQGLVEWIADPDWERWISKDFGSDLPAQLLRDSRGELVLIAHGGLHRFNPALRTWPLIPGTQRNFDAGLPLAHGELLVASREAGLTRLASNGGVIEQPDASAGGRDFRKVAQDRKGRIWVGNKRQLFRLENSPGRWRLIPTPLPDVRSQSNAVDFEMDAEGRLWTGYEGGLAWLDEGGAWRRLKVEPEIRDVRSFGIDGDRIWVALRQSGAFYMLQRNGDSYRSTAFPAESGYSPADTYFLKRDSRGWIWRGCADGVRVCDGRHIGPEDWLHLHGGNGLTAETADINGFFEDRDGGIWIASKEGVTHMRPDATWFGSLTGTPRVSWVAAKVASNANSIALGSMEASPFRVEPFEYRVLPVLPEWRKTSAGMVELQGLPRGTYHVEVNFAGGTASTVLELPLEVKTPIPWAYLLFAAGTGLVYYVARRRRWFEMLRYTVRKRIFLIGRRMGRSEGDEHDLTGTLILGRYQIRSVASTGGFSTVYDATDLTSGARVAVKQFQKVAPERRESRTRFLQEVGSLRSVSHRGVVRILDSCITRDGDPCIVMPFLRGRTLREEIRDCGTFAAPRTARLIGRLAEALDHVHSRGFVHRDVKPDNIILTNPGAEDEEPVLVDFGTAGIPGAGGELAPTRNMALSLRYTAPERISGHFSRATDVYSLGVIALELITGKHLSDLHDCASAAAFSNELTLVLADVMGRKVVGKNGAAELAVLLAGAMNPIPDRRPGIGEWGKAVGAALQH